MCTSGHVLAWLGHCALHCDKIRSHMSLLLIVILYQARRYDIEIGEAPWCWIGKIQMLGTTQPVLFCLISWKIYLPTGHPSTYVPVNGHHDLWNPLVSSATTNPTYTYMVADTEIIEEFGQSNNLGMIATL